MVHSFTEELGCFFCQKEACIYSWTRGKLTPLAGITAQAWFFSSCLVTCEIVVFPKEKTFERDIVRDFSTIVILCEFIINMFDSTAMFAVCHFYFYFWTKQTIHAYSHTLVYFKISQMKYWKSDEFHLQPFSLFCFYQTKTSHIAVGLSTVVWIRAEGFSSVSNCCHQSGPLLFYLQPH